MSETTELLVILALFAGFAALFSVGLLVYRQINKKVINRLVLPIDSSENFEIIESLTLTQMSVDNMRWHGPIGKLEIGENSARVLFNTMSPAKIYFGFRTKGIGISYTDIIEVCDEVGVVMNNLVVGFSKNEHEVLRRYLKHTGRLRSS